MAQNYATGDFSGFIKPAEAENYFKQAYRSSVVQQLARKVPLGPSGTEIAVPQSKASAQWVAEAGKKPVSKGSFELNTMAPKKIASIMVASAEVVRANPANFMQVFRDDVAEAMATAFDAAVLHGTASPFGGTNLAGTSKSVKLGSTTAEKGGVYGDLTAALALLVKDKKKLTGFAFDSQAEPLLLGSVDTNGRPLFTEPVYESTVLTSGRAIGRQATIADGIASTDGTILGFAGDWSQIVWGSVGGITYDVSTEATVTLDGAQVSLWENNLVAIRAEAEYGVLINDVESFVKLTAAGAA